MLIIIAAIGKNNELGKNNQLLWYLPSDLQFFKEMTMGKKMIMGRKTFESFKRPLKGRTHIVLTSNPTISNFENVIFTGNINKLIEEYEDSEEEVFVIGGASIYRSFLNYVKMMYLTEINAQDPSADTYFPEFSRTQWNSEEISSENDNDISYKHLVYTNKK